MAVNEPVMRRVSDAGESARAARAWCDATAGDYQAEHGEFLGSGSFGKLGFGQLASQAIGCLVICTVMFGIVFAFFKIQNAIMKGGIRSSEADEIAGLDLPEMGVLAYDNLQLRELDIVGVDEDIVLTGGASQDPSIGR